MNTCGWSLDKARCDHQLLRVWLLGTEEYGAGGAVTSAPGGEDGAWTLALAGAEAVTKQPSSSSSSDHKWCPGVMDV